MFSLLTRTNVEEVSGREITDFLSGCNDAAFQSWWPGTIGDRRVKVRCELVDSCRAGHSSGNCTGRCSGCRSGWCSG